MELDWKLQLLQKLFGGKKKIFRLKFHLKPKPSPGSPGCQLGGQERQIGALRGSSRVPGAQPIVVHNVATLTNGIQLTKSEKFYRHYQ